jgi:SnoaL-like domain
VSGGRDLPNLTATSHDRTPDPTEDVVARYFEFDASQDIAAILSLFLDDAVVIDEGREWRGGDEIRRWRLGPASKYEYTTTVDSIDAVDDARYQASGRIDGNFPAAQQNSRGPSRRSEASSVASGSHRPDSARAELARVLPLRHDRATRVPSGRAALHV